MRDSASRFPALVLHKSCRKRGVSHTDEINSFLHFHANEQRGRHILDRSARHFSAGNETFRSKRLCHPLPSTSSLCAYNIHIHTYTCINTVLRVPTYLLLFRFFFLFLFVCHAAEAQSRQTQGRHSSWWRMWKYDGNISLFVALARPDDSVAVPRHEAFISKYVHWYVQAPGSSLNKCRSIYKGSKMRVFSLFRSASFPSSSFSISYSSVSSLSFHLFVSFTSAFVFFLFFSIRADDGCK